jgi:nucleoside-diphosphate-sugar epimerase
MSTIVIIGGNSSISKALKPFLNKDHKVFTAGRANCDFYLDLNDTIEQYELPNNIDTLVITAAHFGGKSFDEIYGAENTNVLGIIKLCHLAFQKKVKHIIYISSIFATYDAGNEKADIYSISKKHAEDIVIYLCKQNKINATILRPSQIYGIGNTFIKHQPFLYNIIEKARNKETVYLYGKIDPIRNYIYIDDLVVIISKVIEQNITGVFSCTQLINTTYGEIAKIAFEKFGTNAEVKFLVDKPNIVSKDFLMDESLYKIINYYPQITIQEGLEKIISSIKK